MTGASRRSASPTYAMSRRCEAAPDASQLASCGDSGSAVFASTAAYTFTIFRPRATSINPADEGDGAVRQIHVLSDLAGTQPRIGLHMTSSLAVGPPGAVPVGARREPARNCVTDHVHRQRDDVTRLPPQQVAKPVVLQHSGSMPAGQSVPPQRRTAGALALTRGETAP
jgi:hypothetical protein